MRGTNDHAGARGSQWPRLEQQVQFARGHWRRDEGAVRSAGWWEAVTVTWSGAATPEERPRLWHRALAAAMDTIGPPVAELVAARARQLLARQRVSHAVLSSARRQLPTAVRALSRPAARALPHSDQLP
jgi:hypothetical protein